MLSKQKSQRQKQQRQKPHKLKRKVPFSQEELLFLRNWHIMPVDRTGLLGDCLHNVDEEHPVPKLLDAVTLEQCIDARCEEIAKLDNLSLMWSGGIDSTLVFYALVNHGISFECVGQNLTTYI